MGDWKTKIMEGIRVKLAREESGIDGGDVSDLALYEDEAEQKRHFMAIQRLVKDMRFPEMEIRHLYEDVLKEFKNEARTKTFLPILVSRKVKELLDARTR